MAGCLREGRAFCANMGETTLSGLSEEVREYWRQRPMNYSSGLLSTPSLLLDGMAIISGFNSKPEANDLTTFSLFCIVIVEYSMLTNEKTGQKSLTIGGRE